MAQVEMARGSVAVGGTIIVNDNGYFGNPEAWIVDLSTLTAAVPEPSTWALMCSASPALALRSAKSRRKVGDRLD
jgi:hypothetical protein